MRKRGESPLPTAAPPPLVVPVDIVNEQVVLAAAMAGDDELRDKLLAVLPVESFSLGEHRATWAALRELRRRKLAFDLATLQTLADERFKGPYLAELRELRPAVPENLAHHVSLLHWDRARAGAVRGPLSGLLQALQDTTASPDRVRALAKNLSAAFDAYSDRSHLADPDQLVADQMARVRRRLAGQAIRPYGIEGLDFFDPPGTPERRRRMIPGAEAGQITLVTGVTGSGKSTFTAHLVLGQIRQRRRVLYCAWEMSAGTVLELLTLLALKWDRSVYLDPRGARRPGAMDALSEEGLAMFEKVMRQVADWVTFATNPFRRRGGERSSNLRNLETFEAIIADAACDVVVADLWARCLVDRSPEAEEEALFRQQAMIEELGVHAILLHQQRFKDLEMRADKRPTREGNKGSGAYVEIADTMLGVHRPAQWKQMTDDRLEIFVLKQRYGEWPLGIEFEWNGARGSLEGGKGIAYDPPNQAPRGNGELMRVNERPRR